MLDYEKLSYDLSLLYAKAKFEDVLAHNPKVFEQSKAPASIAEVEYLGDMFTLAYDYLTQAGAEED